MSKGPREPEVELGRGSCIFGALWFLLSQLTRCLAPACQWKQEMPPLMPWFTLSHPLGKQGRGGGRRVVGSLHLPLKPSRLGRSLRPRCPIHLALSPWGRWQLGVSGRRGGGVLGKCPSGLWRAALHPPAELL